ncbi:MAG: hypothetical protein HY558_01105 [Euryarchaeota archaeon]|nr:hypothetical protein [Euryarchaeota archaeon]
MQEPLQSFAEVPPELRGTPGIPREPEQERYYAREYPLRDLLAPGRISLYLGWGIRKALWRYRGDLRATLKACRASGHLEPTGPPAQGDLTLEVKQRARELGIGIAGVAAYNPLYTFENYKEHMRYPHAVVLAMEQGREQTDTIPSWVAELEVFHTYIRLVKAALKLGDHIRSRGYHAQVHHPTFSSAVYHHYFIEAGVGQMGAGGWAISPEYGPRMRITMLTTDAPLTHDTPKDWGIPQFCEKCQVCIRRCPGQAISKERLWWRGVYKHKIRLERCLPMVVKYSGCAVCMKVCPFHKYGYNRVMEHYARTGQVLGKDTDELESYSLRGKGSFGVGKLPAFRKREVWLPGIKRRG